MATLIDLGPLRPEHREPHSEFGGTTPDTITGVTCGYR